MDLSHHVVIVGGGFGGLYAARSLSRAPARVTLIDRQNHHLFQPLLYQVATGALSPANIATPLRGILHRQKNTNVLMAEVVDIDVVARRLVLRDDDPTPMDYDTLIVASGSRYNYFGHEDWSELAPGLKTIEDAVTIRRRVLSAFEKAELEADPAKQRTLMTFVIVGGGPTGVELAGALAEVAHHTLLHDFRNIHPADAQILLFEAQDCILGQFPPVLQRKAAASLARLGVTLRLGALVTAIDAHGVTVKIGGQTETIPSSVVLWTAGVKASPLGAALAQAAGLEPDRMGRVAVEPDLSLAGHQEIFVIGDLASFSHQTGQPLPGLAPVAMQQGHYVADVIMQRLRSHRPPGPFHYRDRGNMATIGRAAAVADLGWLHLSGYLAWLTWLFVHLLFLVQFQNRVLVLIQWAYNYFTRGRAARLITQEPPRVHR
jgi:NADH dehydrogenase